MMSEVEAVYQNGVFKPLHEVRLVENQRVRLSVQPIESSDAHGWLARVQERQRQLVAQRGFFPDSTADISQDRKR